MKSLSEILKIKGLSTIQTQIVVLVAQGLSNTEIANQLFTTEKFVKDQLVFTIYETMRVKSRAQLIVWCWPHTSYQKGILI